MKQIPRKIKFSANMGVVGCTHDTEIEVDDDTTKEEIEKMWVDWIWEYVDGYWEEVKD